MGSRSRRRRAREKAWAKAVGEFREGLSILTDLHETKLEDASELERALLEAASDATPGPYCVFADDGHAFSVMPAGRPGDVCKVEGCVNPDGDARWFTLATPQNVVLALKAARLRTPQDPPNE